MKRLVCALLVAGCGGGDAVSPPPPDAGEPDAGGEDPFTPPAALLLTDITDGSPDLAAHPNAGSSTGFEVVDDYAPGVALADLDGDGALDLVQPRFDSRSSMLRGLFIYKGKGDGSFALAAAPIIAFGRNLTVVLAVDVDGDDDLDLFVGAMQAPVLLLRNDGGMRFVDVAAAAGLEARRNVISASAGDVNGDGWPDLHLSSFDLSGSDDGAGKAPSFLYLNQGDGTFRDVSEQAGIRCYGFTTLGSALVDLDDDGRLDIYDATDWHDDCLYRNAGDGTFVEVASQAGVADGALNGMGLAVADLDGDLDLDVVVADDHRLDGSLGNAVFLSRGPGLMAYDSAATALNLDGIFATGRAGALFWGVGLVDLDLDGHVDVHFTGHTGTPQLFYLARVGAFVEQRPLMEQLGAIDARGSAYGDLDGDGDLDVVVARRNAPLQLLRNDVAAGRALVVAPRPLRFAPGARVTISALGRAQTAVVLAGSSYQSSSPPEAVFGLGGARFVDWIEVRFADGATRRVGSVRAGQRVIVTR